MYHIVTESIKQFMIKSYNAVLYLIIADFNLTHVEQKMFPAKVLADLSSVHGRPTKRPSTYEQHKANLKKRQISLEFISGFFMEFKHTRKFS